MRRRPALDNKIELFTTEVRNDLMPDVEDVLRQMTLQEKVSMLSGADMWHTMPVERLGIPAVKVTDGPN